LNETFAFSSVDKSWEMHCNWLFYCRRLPCTYLKIMTW
jgi:hypothetical protein